MRARRTSSSAWSARRCSSSPSHRPMPRPEPSTSHSSPYASKGCRPAWHSSCSWHCSRPSGSRQRSSRCPRGCSTALSDRDRARDGRLRRPAHQGRRLRDHPDPDAPLPRVTPDRPAHVGRAADHDRRHPRCGVPDGTQANAVLHAGEPHRLHDLRRRPRERARHGRRDRRPTSPSRPRSSSSPDSSSGSVGRRRSIGSSRLPHRCLPSSSSPRP